MDIVKEHKSNWPEGVLVGKFLIAMPGTDADIFADSIIFMCAHNNDGAIGFIINKPASTTFAELVALTRNTNKKASFSSPMIPLRRQKTIRFGGPVDENRGFVLHSPDYKTDATLAIARGICLTSTMHILNAIAADEGPRAYAVCLGYAGWGAGQVESELRNNLWLTCDAEPEPVFSEDNGMKYGNALASLGISTVNFNGEPGHA